MDEKKCYRCGAKPQFNYKSGLIVCSTCFNDQICMRKFRSYLRNSLDVFGKTNSLACAFDGSVNSIMLAHLFAKNTDHTEKMKKRMFLQGEVVYVDFSSLFECLKLKKNSGLNDAIKDLAINPKNANTDLFIKFMTHISGPYKILPIQDYHDIQQLAVEVLRISQIGGYREDYLSILRSKAIRSYMAANEYKKLILADNAQQLAVRSLKLMCKSRTNEISQECAETYTENFKGHEQLIGRPLAEINDREVLYYLKINKLFDFAFDDLDGLKSENTAKLSSLPGEGNINTLLADFVRNLQVK